MIVFRSFGINSDVELYGIDWYRHLLDYSDGDYFPAASTPEFPGGGYLREAQVDASQPSSFSFTILL